MMAYDPRETIREHKAVRRCDHLGCEGEGEYKAPKSRTQLGQFYWFCLDHVREYNKSWNFFSGMSDEEAAAYRHSSNTWHRPTWQVGGGANGKARFTFRIDDVGDRFGLFGGRSPLEGDLGAVHRARRRIAGPMVKALRVLGLPVEASPSEIKIRYKTLAKRFHPDLNGGSKDAEERLKRINEAYSYLVSSGHT